MKTFIIGIAALGALGLGLAACNGSATDAARDQHRHQRVGNPAADQPDHAEPARYVQIELLARPAVKEALESFNNHKVTNKVEPYAGSPADPLQGEIKATVGPRCARRRTAARTSARRCKACCIRTRSRPI